MKPKILLVNPPIYDFAAYDFWIKPLGMLSVAGRLRGRADFHIFDYLNRTDHSTDRDHFHRGPFRSQVVDTPEPLKQIPRKYHRFGLDREKFHEYLSQSPKFDFVFVQTMMTYWYPGVAEIIDDVREFVPGARMILGGPYATVCAEHAKSLGADLVIEAGGLESLWEFVGIEPDDGGLPMWELYNDLKVGAIKITTGCPCKCTYCFVPKYFPKFEVRSVDECIEEIILMKNLGAEDIAFYDDALLYKPENCLKQLLKHIIENNIQINLHTPNAMHAKLITPELAILMVAAGFKTFYLGYESSCQDFQSSTGGKLNSEDLRRAVETLINAGVNKKNVIAYEIVGHPDWQLQNLEASMRYAHDLGIKIMLADYSPIPGTIDGDNCGSYVDLSEPLLHNKTAFPYIVLGESKLNNIKNLCKHLNRNLA